jgi:hypothetical protein
MTHTHSRPLHLRANVLKYIYVGEQLYMCYTKGGFVMATSSFDSVITINRKSAKSIIDILNKENYQFVDLQTSTEVKKVSSSEINTIIKKKSEENAS